MERSQRTLTGEEAPRVPERDLASIEFHYFETNATPVLENNISAYRDQCIENASKELAQIDSVPSELIDEIAEEFVSSTFESVWDLVDGEGYSLWIRHKGKSDRPNYMREYPIYISSPIGTYMSSFTEYHSSDSNSVSESFLRSVGQMILDTEETNNWSNCSEEVWNNLSETEQELFHVVRNAFVGMSDMSVEMSLLIEKGRMYTETDISES